MKVILAETSGFCDGVKRAMRLAIEAADRHGGLAADGPLVHNHQANSLLALQGIVPAGDADVTLPILVRAHGAPPGDWRKWRDGGREIIDATCLHVRHNQRLAARADDDGFAVILAGDREHAEVKAVAGMADGNCTVVSGPDEIDDLALDRPALLLAQTTFNVRLFKETAEALLRHRPDSRVIDTICRATHARQEEAGRLARCAEALVVVGGRHSANTRRLADTGREAGRPVFPVETAEELCDRDFAGFKTVAVTAGASTPGWVTQEVVNRLRGIGNTPEAWLFRLLHFLVESRASTALSAGGLALASGLFAAGSLHPALALAGACFVFFAHTLNRRIPSNPEARRLSPADAFYRSRRSDFLIAAWAAAAAATAIAAAHGAAVFALFLAATAAAALYALPAAAPRKLQGRRNWTMALGWCLVLAWPPALAGGDFARGAGAGAFVLLLCLGGTLIRDLHDIASDRLMGIDTMAAWLGPSRALGLASVCLAAAAALPLCAAAGGLWSPVDWRRQAFVLLLPLAPAIGLFLLTASGKRRVNDTVLLQAGVDGMGAAAGLLALMAGGLP